MQEISSSGVVTYLGGSGIQYGEIYAKDSFVLSTSVGTKIQVSDFNANGLSNGGITPDHVNDHISIGVKGTYDVNVSIAVINKSAQGYRIEFDVYTNNGTTQCLNVHAHRTLSGGSTDIGSIGLNGFCAFSSSDTVELWAEVDTTASRNYIVEDVTMTVKQIGGSTG